VEELLARLRVVERRLALMQSSSLTGAVYENGGLVINYAQQCAYLNDTELHLTPIEYKLLCLLAHNTGKVLTHKYILQNVWGSNLESDMGSLRVFMAMLRKKLNSGQNSPQYIQTHVGIGYRMQKVD
ncbi:MAG TPA: DNA-binding response regulator, partial [Bacteroides sp.]|nr:DNA-binding response regulator [Bacteroides sp.]